MCVMCELMLNILHPIWNTLNFLVQASSHSSCLLVTVFTWICRVKWNFEWTFRASILVTKLTVRAETSLVWFLQ